MRSSKLLLAPVISLAIACGGSSGGATNGSITTSEQAGSASAASSQSLSLAANSNTSLSNLANLSQVTAQLGGAYAPQFQSPLADQDARHAALHAAQRKAMALQGAKLASALQKARSFAAGQQAQVVIDPVSINCGNGGSFTFSGSVDDTSGAFALTLTYDQCRENDEEMNGTTTATGTVSLGGYNFTITIGNQDGIADASQDFTVRLFTTDYVDVYATYAADVILTSSGSCNAEACTLTIGANGQEKYSDFIDDYLFTYGNLSLAGSTSLTNSSNSVTMNGGVSESGSDGSVAVTFTHMVIVTTETASSDEVTADGTVKIDFTPDACSEGTFTIDTQDPIEFVQGQTVAGKVVINGVVTIVYNADGTVTVTLSGQQPVHYNSIDDLDAANAACAIQDMQPQDSTQTVDPSSGTTTTGSTLLATLTWTGGPYSDLDLHLMHYQDTAPTSDSSYDWHVFWADKTNGGVAVLDFDDTEGYGPEHITMDTLPSGYYVLYVDPYDMCADFDSPNYGACDSIADATVTLKIGGNSFQFDGISFTSAGAPDRVVDIRVDSSGNVTLLGPDMMLYVPPRNSWAPKMR